uniref:Uncharacterized protein n=1 Tax=Vitrella brassicaformis TaxID=1169539 RepID=A0A7S1K6B1_9ALVE
MRHQGDESKEDVLAAPLLLLCVPDVEDPVFVGRRFAVCREDGSLMVSPARSAPVRLCVSSVSSALQDAAVSDVLSQCLDVDRYLPSGVKLLLPLRRQRPQKQRSLQQLGCSTSCVTANRTSAGPD